LKNLQHLEKVSKIQDEHIFVTFERIILEKPVNAFHQFVVSQQYIKDFLDNLFLASSRLSEQIVKMQAFHKVIVQNFLLLIQFYF